MALAGGLLVPPYCDFMRFLLLTLAVLAASGCDSRTTTDFTLDLEGSIRSEEGEPLADPNVYLVGELIDTPDIIFLLQRVEPDTAGEYTLRYDFPLLREDASGACVVLVGDDAKEVRLLLTAGDGQGGYAAGYPDCVEDPQRLDLVVRDLFGRAAPEVAPGGLRRLTR